MAGRSPNLLRLFVGQHIVNGVSVGAGVIFVAVASSAVFGFDAGQPATLCKGGLYTRLDKYRDLIVNAANAASNNWSLYPKPVPDWTIYVPPPPDAGAPDAGPKKPKPQDDGFACDTNADCKSNVCADTGAGKACTQSCDATVVPTTCPDGFACKASVCVQDLGGTPVAAAPCHGQSVTLPTLKCRRGSWRDPADLPASRPARSRRAPLLPAPPCRAR